jgi:hypothetical protein
VGRLAFGPICPADLKKTPTNKATAIAGRRHRRRLLLNPRVEAIVGEAIKAYWSVMIGRSQKRLTGNPGGKPNFILILGISLFGVTKEVVGILLVLTCSLFGVDMLRSLLPRVWPVKSTSVPLRF